MREIVLVRRRPYRRARGVPAWYVPTAAGVLSLAVTSAALGTWIGVQLAGLAAALLLAITWLPRLVIVTSWRRLAVRLLWAAAGAAAVAGVGGAVLVLPAPWGGLAGLGGLVAAWGLRRAARGLA